jgi:hypothetical protein
MEKQMRADRDKRAAILSAEGNKQSAILNAEGARQAAVLKARGESEAAVLRAEAEAKAQAVRARGQAEAITTVFRAIHEGNPDQRLLAYQYMQMLPQIAQGDANKVWIVPSEIGKALEGIGGLVSSIGGQSAALPTPGPTPGPAAAPTALSTPGPAAAPTALSTPGPAAAPTALSTPGPATAPLAPAPRPEPTLSGPGPQFDPSIGRHAGLEGWLAGSSGPVHDGTVGDGEGGSVPGAGHAGSTPFDDDPSLVERPA